ncbi:MAG TPA: hypothetical protein VNK26_02470, partial [Pyrinomonadaceae bacterium]|nr:hypothetical protein [Pyrinomonadaceae bacterium]
MTQAVKSTSEIISKQLLPRPATTAAISPQDFEAFSLQVSNKHLFYLLVACIIGLAFCFRVFELGVESFGEDEFNKFETIQEYRQKGLTGRNGE